jgi:hypothetical protein
MRIIFGTAYAAPKNEIGSTFFGRILSSSPHTKNGKSKLQITVALPTPVHALSLA